MQIAQIKEALAVAEQTSMQAVIDRVNTRPRGRLART
jgi:hypothetical protein